MAAYGGADAVAALGNQIFVTLQKGSHYPPTVVDVRVKYDQTVKDIKAAVAKKTGVPADKQQLFWHQKELTPAYDNKTLLDMHLHTGFSLRGYDLTEQPHYFPPVKQTQEGLVVDEDACSALCSH
ncbi:hypothetical protein ABBQ32_006120 [Trebouxia sp. C0010 RCD-2024]